MAEAAKARVRRVPQRAGWRMVARKELADHILSVRFTILVLLLSVVALGTVYVAAGQIRDVAPAASGVPSLFIRLFSIPHERFEFLSMIGMVSLLAPLLGIAFGFDAVNGERAQGTLPRLVSQPIHRDDVINGKFASGLVVIGTALLSLTMLVAGLGLLRLGITPTVEETLRMMVWLVVTIVYVGFWLGFATMLSVILQRAATSALVAIATWLVLTLFFGLLVGLVSDAVSPVPENATIDELANNARTELRLARVSPATLYDEATLVLLTPEQRTIGFLLPQQTDQALPTQLSLQQSLLLVWPQVVGLVALTVLVFAVAYVQFMKQEIRA